jgi:ureidoacrylate peracid hydrolase
MRLDAARCVLLLVDLQRSFLERDGAVAAQGLEIEAMREAARTCGRLAGAARERGIPVIWTRMMFRPDYEDGGVLTHELRPNLARIGALRKGSEDADIVPWAGYQADELIIDKPRFSALYGTPLEVRLRAAGVDNVVVAGITTSMCVETTVRDLGQRDWRTFVAGDACGDFDGPRHEASLAAMEFGFARVVETGDVERAFAQGEADL